MGKPSKSWFKSFAPSIIWALLILFLSALPGGMLKEINWTNLISLDKLGHLIVYAILAYLLTVGNSKIKEKQKRSTSNFLGIFLLCAGYGFLLEGMQFLVFTERYFEFLDLIANIIGSLIGIITYKYVKNN